MPLVNTATEYYHPYGNTYILRFNQALVMLEEDIRFRCPFKMWANEFIVECFTRHFEKEGRRKRHSIIYPQGDIECTLALSGAIIHSS